MPPFKDAPVRSGTELGFPNTILNKKNYKKSHTFSFRQPKEEEAGAEREEEKQLRWPNQTSKSKPEKKEVCFPLPAKEVRKSKEDEQ